MSAPVERNSFATRLCESLGTSGVALEGRVFLAPDADARVLRHELAHIAQQRLWRGHAVPTAWTELEAHAVAAGHLGRARLPLDPMQPACWEEVGHYYTVYYVLFAAGVRDDLARQIAFYAQLPDEVSELDATRAGYSFAATSLALSASMSSTYAMMHQAPRSFDDLTRSLNIQRGLHALTGGNCETETTRRTGILRNINPVQNPLDFGLALHAFGDSYAHRVAGGLRMYSPVLGHASDTLASWGERRGHLPEMHVHPDAIGPHHAALYVRYATDLHLAFLHAFPPGSRTGEPMDLATLTRNLQTVVAASDAAADTDAEHRRQIVQLRELARAIVPAGMHAYDPEHQNDVPIDDFAPGHTDIRVTRWQIQHALARAGEWSGN